MEDKETKNIEQELEDCKKRSQEYLDNWKRERADFINYKKDEAKRMEEFVKFANEALILEMIDVLDDLEIAAKHVSGTEQVLKKFQDLLAKHGVERIKTNEQFDPSLHEAVSSESREPFPEGVRLEGNIQEVRAGYIMNGKIIRPARVRFLASKIVN